MCDVVLEYGWYVFLLSVRRSLMKTRRTFVYLREVALTVAD